MYTICILIKLLNNILYEDNNSIGNYTENLHDYKKMYGKKTIKLQYFFRISITKYQVIKLLKSIS